MIESMDKIYETEKLEEMELGVRKRTLWYTVMKFKFEDGSEEFSIYENSEPSTDEPSAIPGIPSEGLDEKAAKHLADKLLTSKYMQDLGNYRYAESKFSLFGAGNDTQEAIDEYLAKWADFDMKEIILPEPDCAYLDKYHDEKSGEWVIRYCRRTPDRPIAVKTVEAYLPKGDISLRFEEVKDLPAWAAEVVRNEPKDEGWESRHTEEEVEDADKMAAEMFLETLFVEMGDDGKDPEDPGTQNDKMKYLLKMALIEKKQQGKEEK